jgi:hypothetical protein
LVKRNDLSSRGSAEKGPQTTDYSYTDVHLRFRFVARSLDQLSNKVKSSNPQISSSP